MLLLSRSLKTFVLLIMLTSALSELLRDSNTFWQCENPFIWKRKQISITSLWLNQLLLQLYTRRLLDSFDWVFFSFQIMKIHNYEMFIRSKTSATIDCKYMKAIGRKVNTNTSLKKSCIYKSLNQKELRYVESVR